MSKPIRRIVIVGGGTAGWITAGLLASQYPRRGEDGLEIVLVESPDHPIIGVGEGTWPTMRTTLKQIGISEADLIRECDASFKQGSRFCGWVDGSDGDAYLHPFTAPAGYEEANLVPCWLNGDQAQDFAHALCFQSTLCDLALAPKAITTPEYAGAANYAYHLNAGKFGEFVGRHCTEKLGVTHRLEEIIRVRSDASGDIVALDTRSGASLEGDLFIDCTGFASLLVGRHFETRFRPLKDILFIDSAWAVQAPYLTEDAPISSVTTSTAQSAGWVWDIGLSTRRGIGHVFSSAHTTDDAALAELRAYVAREGLNADDLSFRKLSINSGYRERFWVRNCVAVGLSAGFLEPLEASAIVMVELSAKMIAENLPQNRGAMDRVARMFNDAFTYRWERIVDFLKLHYVLSKRTDSAFWVDNRRAETIPDSLREGLDFWRYHVPWHDDFTQKDEIFSAASYQYVLFGMGFNVDAPVRLLSDHREERARARMQETQERSAVLARTLPNNRDLIRRIARHGLQKI